VQPNLHSSVVASAMVHITFEWIFLFGINFLSDVYADRYKLVPLIINISFSSLTIPGFFDINTGLFSEFLIRKFSDSQR
jgi:hypothetical protein